MLLDEFPDWFVVTFATLLGLTVGSFLNVVIYRLPRELSLVRPGSACPACGVPIALRDNIPVLGWILLGGKARCCAVRISARYPMIELLGGLMAWAIVHVRLLPYRHDLLALEAGGLFVLYLALGLGLLALALIDLEHMILPDSLTWGGAALGLLSSPFRPEADPIDALLGAVLGYVLIWLPFIWLHTKVRGFAGMGLGDAKLMALAGAWFGPLSVLVTLFAGAIQGTLFAAASIAIKGKIEEPQAVKDQRAELLLAISAAEGAEKLALLKEYEDDPLAPPPDEALGGARIAFGPFLALALIEQLLFFDTIQAWLKNYLYL